MQRLIVQIIFQKGDGSPLTPEEVTTIGREVGASVEGLLNRIKESVAGVVVSAGEAATDTMNCKGGSRWNY